MDLLIPTERESVCLRQLASPSDDRAYFDAVESSRVHLSQFGDETATKYPTLEAVTEARTNPTDPDKLRLGIWNGDILVGSINLRPDSGGGAEIGYWLGEQHTGNGYATLAVKALGKYARQRYARLYASVTAGNTASEAVLGRAGYRVLTREAGRVIFALDDVAAVPRGTKPERRQPETTSAQQLERFAELPDRRTALRAKDTNNLTVFLAFGVAKKLYRCPCCNDTVAIGAEHVIVSCVQVSTRYTHHHLHYACAQREILPVLVDIKAVKAKDASAVAVNERRRRYRNGHRNV